MFNLDAGIRIGNWELLRNIGKGGNAEVWKVRGPEGELAAMKIGTKPKESAFERFKAEVHIHQQHADVPGVLPVVDYMLTDVFDPERPSWFVMPLAGPFRRAVRKDFCEIIGAVIKVAETLEILHERGVVHRDLKPENLLHFDGRPCVGDFGIADYPTKPELTGKNKLGAYWTIAPEMERYPDTADGRKADVYSLAKTMWMLLVNDKRSFAGQYLPGRRPMALSAYFSDVPLLHVIEGLLATATANEPDERPDMSAFLGTLKKWELDAGDFKKVSLGDWAALQDYLFPVSLPQRAVWTAPEEIVAVINLLGQHAELNHAFAPDGGGLDLAAAKFSVEEDCIELVFEAGMVVVVKPLQLIFESFEGFSEWAYFRLETSELPPSGTYNNVAGNFEEVLELTPGEYVSRTVYDEGCLHDGETGEEIPFPDTARVVTRQFNGSFVIFAKASHYNEIDQYKGDHNRFTADGFREQIDRIVREYGQKIRDTLGR